MEENTKELTGYPSIDKPWVKYYKQEWNQDMIPKMTVYRNIWENNKNHLDDIAISFKGFKTSYKEMFAQVETIAKSLKAIGINKGDCVNMCVSYVSEAVCLLLACSKIGALANFINPLFTSEQKVDRINDTQAKVLIILDAMFDYMKDAISNIQTQYIIVLPAINSIPFLIQSFIKIKSKKNKNMQIFINSDSRYLSWKEFIKAGNAYDGETEISYEKDRPVVMVYSSGSTGASKGIVLTNDGINTIILHDQISGFSYKREDTFLSMIPIWFSTGNVLSMLMPLCLGITIILEPVFSKETFVEDVLKYKPNMALTATSLWVHLMKCGKIKNMDLSFFKYTVSGGEPIRPEVEKEIALFFKEHNMNVPLVKGYGMCELGSTVTDSIIHNKLGSVGCPIEGVTVAAFDLLTNEELPYGKRGEIRVDTPARMKGYFNNLEATNEFFKKDKNGIVWGCTGDIGYVDEDGDVFILGRASDSYYSENGQLIYCFDGENVIMQDTAVSSCKIVQSEIEGKKVSIAHIILESNSGQNVEEIISRIYKLCNLQLESYAVPQYYKLHNTFPVHTNGKQDNEALMKDVEGVKHFR